MIQEKNRTEKIIRTYVHDVRNYINSLDLEAVLLGELVTDSAVIEILQRMRAQLGQLEADVKGLLFKFAAPQPMQLTAADLLHLWKYQMTPLEDSSHKIEWAAPTVSKALTIDAHALVSLLRELVIGAWRRSRGAGLKATVKTSEQCVVVELREPLHGTRLSDDALFEYQRVVEINGGQFEQIDDPLTDERIISLSFVAENC